MNGGTPIIGLVAILMGVFQAPSGRDQTTEAAVLPLPDTVASGYNGRSPRWFVEARGAPQRSQRNGLHR